MLKTNDNFNELKLTKDEYRNLNADERNVFNLCDKKIMAQVDKYKSTNFKFKSGVGLTGVCLGAFVISGLLSFGCDPSAFNNFLALTMGTGTATIVSGFVTASLENKKQQAEGKVEKLKNIKNEFISYLKGPKNENLSSSAKDRQSNFTNILTDLSTSNTTIEEDVKNNFNTSNFDNSNAVDGNLKTSKSRGPKRLPKEYYEDLSKAPKIEKNVDAKTGYSKDYFEDLSK